MRYEISKDTVTDTKTGLVWQRAVSEERFTWAESKAYAAQLQLDGGGWRVPEKEELETIVDKARNNPAIDTEAFPNAPSEFFWSASPPADDSNGAWDVDFSNGNTYYDDISIAYRVRCVRSTNI